MNPAPDPEFAAVSGQGRYGRRAAGNEGRMRLLLWLIAAVLVIAGIVQLFQGQIILGIVLIVVGLLVGPGGYSIFRSRPSRY